MSRSYKLGLAASIVLLIAAAWGLGAIKASGASAATAGTTISLQKSTVGTILTADGEVLYYFSKDKGAKSSCFGACAQAWPPLESSKPLAAKGVSQKLLGTIKRGSARQVTYKGHPLYFYATTEFMAEVWYIGVNNFNGIWEGIKADGAPVR